MKKFFLASCLLFFGSGLFALGLSANYFSPSGATVGITNGGNIFSFGYGLLIDSHSFTSTDDDYYYSSGYYGNSYSSRNTTRTEYTFDFGPYVQLDWAILPIKFNLGANQMAIGINTGIQVAALYSSYNAFDCALAGLVNAQIRYKNFDVLLGYKPSLYIMEMAQGSSLHSSFQIELRYYFGKRGFKKSSSSTSSSVDSYNSPSDNTNTRVIRASAL